MNEVKNKLIGLFMLLAMLIAVWYFFFNLLISDKLEPIEAKIDFVENQIVEAIEMKGGLRELIEDFEDARDAVMLLRDRMGFTLTVDSILLQIRVEAAKHGLQVQTLAPKLSLNSFDDQQLYNIESVRGLLKLPLELRLRGDYLSFAKFIAGMKEENIPYSVEELRIRRKFDELPILSFHVVMYLFLIKNDTELTNT